ncbi:MAG: TldD/PmbA family protein, partial [Promethearchaeota archaeon]
MGSKKDQMLAKASLVVKEAEAMGASQTEARVVLQRTSLTRLANSIIDQNVSDNIARVCITLYYGQKKGTVRVDVFDDDSIKAAVKSASSIAKISPDIKEFKSLPNPKPYSDALDGEDLAPKGSLEATPEQRAEFAMTAVSTAHDVDSRIRAVAGAVSHQATESVLVNSLGVETHSLRTRSNINLTIMAEDGTEETAGWAEDHQRDFSKLNVVEVARKAAEKAATGFGMRNLEPGEYEIVLESSAISGLTFYMGYIGFSAMSYQDYRSFLIDKLGEKMFSDSLFLWDDSLDPRHITPAIADDEGIPKSRIDLVESGVVKNLVYNSLTAAKDGLESTGHHAEMWGQGLPFPRHMIIKEGDSNLDEMIAETKRGILVTHFHYQNPVDPTKGVLTGLTRDGTWYIENGEIKWPLKTLRYTDALPRFLGNVDLIGGYGKLRHMNYFFPPRKLPSFRISGS